MQRSLLVALSLTGGAPLLRLAEELGLDRSTMTRNLAPLERDGLIASAPGPDRRVRLVTLTDRGRRALVTALPLWEKAQRRVLAALGARRFHELNSVLRATAAMTGDAASAEG
jgi:DNA-binding MarR family transcriptional regulator